jgi:cytochrome P450
MLKEADVTRHEVVAESDIDLFSEELYDDPYPAYRELRDLGAVVYMRKHDFYALMRYDDVRAADGDWETFSSHGVALLPQFNEMLVGTVIATDPPDHAALRAALSEQLAPRAINRLGSDIRRQADELVRSVSELGSFDAVTQLAQVMPVSIVADLIGIPDEGREILLPGAAAFFSVFGPMNPFLEKQVPIVMEFNEWMASVSHRDQLSPGSWGAAIWKAVDEGRISEESALPLMVAFLVAGMDTTVNAIGAMMRVFAEQPETWTALRHDPGLTAAVFEETLRFESPVQTFFRRTTRDVEIEDAVIPAGSSVCLHFGSANRDERHYPDPDRFDIHRNPLDHMAFGYGTHGCAGQALARLEARAIVGALLDHVDHIAPAGPPRLHYNTIARGLGSLPVTVTRKAAER